MPRWAIGGVVALLALVGGVRAAAKGRRIPEKEPSAKARGDLLAWKAKDGLVYDYRIPESYDPETGAGLTVILHGSNLDHRWGFANHSSKTFRPDVIVVSPDGTTPNGNGGFNFLGKPNDAKRVHALIQEWKLAFKVTGTYLYGHSQGSFFALYYAGEYPQDVDGVVAHASGVWTWTKQPRKAHRQAIVLMHGTQDPVVPYGQSVGGWESYVKRGYPMVRLRSLEGWNHWPSEHNLNMDRQAVPHTSQQLAWVEGMTTQRPDRLAWCLDFLGDNHFHERHDYAGAWSLARHVEKQDGAAEKLKARAGKIAASIEALAEAHVEELASDMKPGLPFAKAAWVGHLPMFLRTFNGVPACDAFFGTWGKDLEAQHEHGIKHFTAYWRARDEGDEKRAFEAGLEALDEAFLYVQTADFRFRKAMKDWRKDAKRLELPRKKLKLLDARMAAFEKSLELGAKAFDRLNRKHGKLP